MTDSVLVVDDDVDVAMLMRDALRKRGVSSDMVHSAASCLDVVQAKPIAVVVTDIRMDGMSGIELCKQIRQLSPSTIPIVVTGEPGVEPAIQAIRAGAFDFLSKPLKPDLLGIAVERALQHARFTHELARLRSTAATRARDGIAGQSEPILAMKDMINRVSQSDATVLITGESGTGKELVAHALHASSSYAQGPFVASNCAAVPAPLLESELFGHARGAFTDAHTNRQGLFVQANHGTIFLDEIGEMPMEMQVKLLRVLQERSVRAVGADHETKIQTRVIAATNRDLEHEIENKRFREDLFYRLNVVHIHVPPLRERGDDVLLLAHRFMAEAATRAGKEIDGLAPHAAKMLLMYDWPGNVRELENCIERAVVLAKLSLITVADLPSKIVRFSQREFVIDAKAPSELTTLEETSLRYVRTVMLACGGNKSKAATILGIDRRSIYRRLEDINRIDHPADDAPPSTPPIQPPEPTE